MTLLTLQDDLISSDDQRTLLLGVTYDAPFQKHLELDEEIGFEHERYDDQILAGLVSPW